jgi:phage/plasmid primase-like uncharacterized protein
MARECCDHYQMAVDHLHSDDPDRLTIEIQECEMCGRRDRIELPGARQRGC